jgi:hypothetical protein
MAVSGDEAALGRLAVIELQVGSAGQLDASAPRRAAPR